MTKIEHVKNLCCKINDGDETNLTINQIKAGAIWV